MTEPDRTDEIRWRVASAERNDLRRIGDLLQSEASRLAEWAEVAMQANPTTLEMPYEVRAALLNIKSAVADWSRSRAFNWPQMVYEQMAPPAPTEPSP